MAEILTCQRPHDLCHSVKATWDNVSSAPSMPSCNGVQSRVFLIGGDCPGISFDYLAQADEQLYECDLVIGPATDGGYVLLGLKSQCTALFENIAWSTQAVLDQTVTAARRQSLSVRLLPTLEDIDDAASLARQARLLPFSLADAEKKSAK